MPLPESVIACECWARDGLQSLPVFVSTDHKVQMIERIARAGFAKLEVTSFSNPKLLPQFADAAEVLGRIARHAGVSYVVLMPNTRGFDRFETCQKEGRHTAAVLQCIGDGASQGSKIDDLKKLCPAKVAVKAL